MIIRGLMQLNCLEIAACFWHQSTLRKGALPSNDELQSCLSNEIPGSPKLSILSFKGGFHGRTFGALRSSKLNLNLTQVLF